MCTHIYSISLYNLFLGYTSYLVSLYNLFDVYNYFVTYIFYKLCNLFFESV